MNKKKIIIISGIIAIAVIGITIGVICIHNKNKPVSEESTASTATIATKYVDENSSVIASSSSDGSSSFDNSVEAQRERHPYLNEDGTINEEKYQEFLEKQRQQALDDAINASPDKDGTHEDADESEDMINSYLLKFQSGEIKVDTLDKTAIQSDYKIMDIGEFIYDAAIYLYTNQEACGDPTSLILHKTDNIQYVDVTLQNGYTYSLSFTSNNGDYTFTYLNKAEATTESSEVQTSKNNTENSSESRSRTMEETEFDNEDETTYTTTTVNDGNSSSNESENADISDSNN